MRKDREPRGVWGYRGCGRTGGVQVGWGVHAGMAGVGAGLVLMQG